MNIGATDQHRTFEKLRCDWASDGIGLPGCTMTNDCDRHKRLPQRLLLELAEEAGLEVRLAVLAQKDYGQVLAEAAYAPVAYTRAMVDYQMAYMSSPENIFDNLTILLYRNTRAVGIWPLCARCENGVWEIGSNEGPVLPPLLVDDLSEKTEKEILRACLRLIELICRARGISSWEGVQSIRTDGTDFWHRQIMERGAKVNVTHELYVDLSMDLAKIKASMRKSFRSLVSRGRGLWEVRLFESVSAEVFSEFRDLHRNVAGRSTRSKETWDLQSHAVNAREAFLVVLRENGEAMVGGGLFHVSRTEGLYAVGAYDRALFDQPLGHIVQMTAIEHMKTLGLRWYKLGARPYPGDTQPPSEKELSIAHFKEGFATHVFLSARTRSNV